MIIERNVYLNRLISRMHNGMIKIITGIRRSGKSFLLFKLFYGYLLNSGVQDEQIIRISLDDEEHREYCDPIRLHEYILSHLVNRDKQYYVFIDEAQYAIAKDETKNRELPIRLYGILNGLLRKENVDVYITGSNSKFLSSDVLTEFRGRGDEIHISPLSFSEFFPASGKDRVDAWREYSVYGGLPHILKEKNDADKVRYLNYLNQEIYIKDIQERYSIRDTAAMESLMKFTASAIGSLTNPKRISDTFTSSGLKGISVPTIGSYLNYLQESFILRKAERYDVKGRKYISTPAKYYYSDIGLRNALLNFRQYEETHIMENIIYNELVFRGYQVDVGIVEVNVSENGRSMRKQLEVDFVVNLGNRRYYIQSAYALPNREKMQREQASLIHIPDSFKKIIVVAGNSPLWRNEEGVMIINLFDFLLKSNSLDL
ncbi:MAG: ATP-binding protein [Saccharofermentanales bacterium]|jgi:predicted AAA+ superfamily ATPase